MSDEMILSWRVNGRQDDVHGLRPQLTLCCLAKNSLAVSEGEYCGGNKELVKHPLLTGDCQGSPAPLDPELTG